MKTYYKTIVIVDQLEVVNTKITGKKNDRHTKSTSLLCCRKNVKPNTFVTMYIFGLETF